MTDAPIQGEVVLANQTFNQPRVTNADIWEALEQSEGNIAVAARALGLGRTKLQERIDRCPDLIVHLSDMREEVIDVAESNTMKRAKSGADPVAEKFVLQTIGKRRGWSTASIGGNGGGDIVVTIKKFAEE
jgi:hypothetical protein